MISHEEGEMLVRILIIFSSLNQEHRQVGLREAPPPPNGEI